MIEITDKSLCSGCGACANICPRQCITMTADSEGFLYPTVEKSLCTDCGMCVKVCPLADAGDSRPPLKVFAAKNRDESVRSASSSGGVFTALAEDLINRRGVVFGVSFGRDWNTAHTYTETVGGLSAFRGSKYVQSNTGTSFKEARAFLRSGREVLFTGTPCQIAGLKRYLAKDYPNLLTVEVLCHGVPSPGVWQSYLAAKKAEHRNSEISHISFRDKKTGWADYHFSIRFGDGSEYNVPYMRDNYFRGFLRNLYLRPSCYRCLCKNGRAGSDIVIADYWNIGTSLPAYDDNKGVSLVLAGTEKGLNSLKAISSGVDFVETGIYDCTGDKNGGFLETIPVHRKRDEFFSLLRSGQISAPKAIERCLKVSLAQKVINRIRRTLHI